MVNTKNILFTMAMSCDVCYELFLTEKLGDGIDRRPILYCPNGHTFCSDCCSKRVTCPNCRASPNPKQALNVSMLKVIAAKNEALNDLPEVPFSEITLDIDAIGYGATADVFAGKWLSTKVAVKKLRKSPTDAEKKRLKLETSIAVSLLHPNLIRCYGWTNMTNKMGIVMELADQGSLREHIKNLSEDQRLSIAQNICSGVAYLHQNKIAHRDLKPENILMFGPNLMAKISDFGTSKNISTMMKNTAQTGTPKYAAPELLDEGVVYGSPVDVFSLAIMIYEIFTGCDPYPTVVNIYQYAKAMITDQRPVIPVTFPKALRVDVQNGWAKNPSARPPIKAFVDALETMVKKDPLPIRAMVVKHTTRPAVDQTREVGIFSIPVPLISMQWSAGCEKENSKALREIMTNNISTSSNMKSMIIPSILRAMKVVPRHLFMDPNRVSGSDAEKLDHAYTYNKAMGATEFSNESSPEIIGVQLSLVKIITGARVLLVGGKGGYINSLVAQVVGFNGEVVTMSSNKKILEVCKIRAFQDSPLANIMDWKWNEDVSDADKVMKAIATSHKFHAIIYCGVINELPKVLASRLEVGGSLIAPVQIGEHQQFQMIIQESADKQEIRKITEFGVIFEKVK